MKSTTGIAFHVTNLPHIGNIMSHTSCLSAISFAVLTLLAATDAAQACSSLLVGNKASADGSVIIARNEDYYINNWNKRLVLHAARNAEKDEVLSFKNGLKVPAPAHLLRYSGLMDWNGDTPSGDGLYEERGVNEHNVAVSASNSAEVNERAKKADPLIDSGVIEAAIPSLLLPQARTAREAVSLLAGYIDRYGAGEGNGVLIADLQEAWYMEIGSGHHYLAYRVPQDSYIMVANGLRLHDIDLDDTANVIASPGLADFVSQHGLLDKVDRRRFNFAKAFGVIGDRYNVDREWLGQHLLNPSLTQKIRQQQYPLTIKPEKAISVSDVARVLRARFDGTALANVKDADRPMGVDRTIETHIIQLRANMPAELAALTWQSFGSPAGALLLPLYEGALKDVPQPLRQGSATYDTVSAYWAFRANATLAQTQPAKYGPLLKAWQSKQEARLTTQQTAVDGMLRSLHATAPDAAVAFANQWSNGMMLWAVQSARDLNATLLTDITKSTEKKYSSAELEKIKAL